MPLSFCSSLCEVPFDVFCFHIYLRFYVCSVLCEASRAFGCFLSHLMIFDVAGFERPDAHAFSVTPSPGAMKKCWTSTLPFRLRPGNAFKRARCPGKGRSVLCWGCRSASSMKILALLSHAAGPAQCRPRIVLIRAYRVASSRASSRYCDACCSIVSSICW